MNAQQQDIIRLLTSRGPMTSRALFDIMQDDLGYWSQAGTHDQQQAAIEALSKLLSKLKSQGIIGGELTPQEKGRPVMTWSMATANDDHVPQEAEMVSDIAELSDDDGLIAYQQGEVAAMRIIDNSKRIETYNGIEILEMTARAESDGCYLRGETVIRNKAQLAQFIGAIERMLP